MKIENTQNAGKVSGNYAIQCIAATLGVIFGISGMGHGFFETLQGNTATGGLVVNAIGVTHMMWAHGNEPAFTIIPNFLFSGIAAMTVGAAVIIWSAKYMHKKNATLVFLLLFVLLFLVGGGIAQVIFFVIGWAFSTRIHKPLHWWRKAIPTGARRFLSKVWFPFLIISSLLLLNTLQIAIFGFVPGVSDPDTIRIVMLSTAGASLLFLILAFISGFAHDIDKVGVTNG